MANPEEILHAMKINLETPSRAPLPEVVKSSALPVLNGNPQTTTEGNTILSHYGLPTFNESDELAEKLAVLVSLEQLGVPIPADCAKLQAVLEKAGRYKQTEMECDKYEIELANLEASNNIGYRDISLDDLKILVSQKKKEYEMVNSLCSSDVARVNEMLIARDLNKLSEFLESMRLETAGISAYAHAVELLQARQDDWCRAILLIVSGITSVEDLGAMLSIDRVGVLRVIYQLCSKGILDYDRLADTVRIVSEEPQNFMA